MAGGMAGRCWEAVDQPGDVWFQDVFAASVAYCKSRVLRRVLDCVVSAHSKHGTVPRGSQNPLEPVMVYGALGIGIEVQPYV